MSFLCWVNDESRSVQKIKRQTRLMRQLMVWRNADQVSRAQPGNDILDTVARHPTSDELLSIISSDARMNMSGIRVVDRGATAGTGSESSDGRLSRRPQDDLLCDMDLPFRGSFFPLGYSIEVTTNSPAVLAAATESFGHMRASREDTRLQIRIGVSGGGSSACPPEPTRREFNHLYSLVADVENQAFLDLETGTNFTWLTQAAVDNRLYFRSNFLEKTVYLLLGATVVTDIHAACVSKNGKGILLCGETGAGKTTLAYACARAGWTYTSDDTSYLINVADPPRVIGHSHRVRFRPSAKQLFPELEGHAVTPRMEGKPSIEVPIAGLPISHTAAEAEVHSIVYLKRYPSASGKLVRLPDGTASRRAGEELYSAGQIREKHLKSLQALREVPTYELEYYDLDAAIETLESLTSGTRGAVVQFARSS
jgi:hypothetical protein